MPDLHSSSLKILTYSNFHIEDGDGSQKEEDGIGNQEGTPTISETQIRKTPDIAYNKK